MLDSLEVIAGIEHFYNSHDAVLSHGRYLARLAFYTEDLRTCTLVAAIRNKPHTLGPTDARHLFPVKKIVHRNVGPHSDRIGSRCFTLQVGRRFRTFFRSSCGLDLVAF